MEEYCAEIAAQRKKVSSKAYISWIYEYISDNKHLDDESILYTYEDIDEENGQILSAFFDYIKNLAIQQRVLVTSDEECAFENERVFN